MKLGKVFLTCVGLVGVGCGDDGQQPASDAPPGDVLTPIPVTITITTLGAPPELIAYREAGGPTPGPWQALDKAATQFAVAGPAYELLAVCQQGAQFSVGIRAERVADEITPFLPCYAYAPVAAPPAPVAVGGQMTTAGTVVLGSSASSETAPWTFGLEATPGLHELIAFGANKYVVRTGVDITAATTVSTVNPNVEGMAAKLLTFVLTGVGSDTVSTEVDYLTDHEVFALSRVGMQAALPPAALLTANDLIGITLRSATGPTERSVDVVMFTGDPDPALAYTLLAPLGGVQFGPSSASWTSLPTGATSLTMYGAGSSYVFHAGSGWLAGKTTLAIDVANVPGWLPAWTIDPATASRTLRVTQDGATAAVTLGSSVSDGVVRTTPARDRRLAQAERAARARRAR